MTDRELLESAARAAGIVGQWELDKAFVQERWYFNVPYDNQNMLTGFEWNPLKDDGDAFRLAVKLKMEVDFWYKLHDCSCALANAASKSAKELHNNDPYAATRRAIVRAAAEIGKGESK